MGKGRLFSLILTFFLDVNDGIRLLLALLRHLNLGLGALALVEQLHKQGGSLLRADASLHRKVGGGLRFGGQQGEQVVLNGGVLDSGLTRSGVPLGVALVHLGDGVLGKLAEVIGQALGGRNGGQKLTVSHKVFLSALLRSA